MRKTPTRKSLRRASHHPEVDPICQTSLESTISNSGSLRSSKPQRLATIRKGSICGAFRCRSGFVFIHNPYDAQGYVSVRLERTRHQGQLVSSEFALLGRLAELLPSLHIWGQVRGRMNICQLKASRHFGQ